MVSIVAVEDNPSDAQLLKQALKSSQTEYKLTIFEDAVSAAEYLWNARTGASQLIILDLKLPERSGLELLHKLKADKHLRRVPVVVFAGSDNPSDILSAYALHANCYLLKKRSAAEHLRTLRTMLDFWVATACLPGQEAFE